MITHMQAHPPNKKNTIKRVFYSNLSSEMMGNVLLFKFAQVGGSENSDFKLLKVDQELTKVKRKLN